MKYFNEIKTINELKKEYKKLAMKLHPDRNKHKDTTAEFQEMQNEYEKVFEQVKNIHKNSKGETYTKETNENIEVFKNIIEKIIHFELVNIEIIGDWIWLSGNTKSYKDEIKDLKFRWSSNKLAWYYHEGQFRKKSKNNYSLDELRQQFGSEIIENEYQRKLA